MGLDMYLYASRYVSGYDFSKDKQQFAGILEVLGAEPWHDVSTPSATVQITAAYWRKANAIHRWFVERVQNGVDDCGLYEVSREDLIELADLCDVVIQSIGLDPLTGGEGEGAARSLLPPQDGFFFGDTEIDQWYYDSLAYTRDRIRYLLANVPEDVYFEYRSSW